MKLFMKIVFTLLFVLSGFSAIMSIMMTLYILTGVLDFSKYFNEVPMLSISTIMAIVSILAAGNCSKEIDKYK